MGCPASVRDGNLRVEYFGRVDRCGRDPLTETSDFTDFLEEKDLPRSISIDADAGRVVAAIFLAGKTVAEDVTNLLASLAWERDISRLSVRG